MSFGNLTLLLCKTRGAILYCFCTPTWPSHHVDANGERDRENPYVLSIWIPFDQLISIIEAPMVIVLKEKRNFFIRLLMIQLKSL